MSNELTPVQQGWLRVASIREQLFTDLQNAELSVQGTLSGIEGNTHLGDVQNSIKTAKATMTEAKEKRLAFSRMIDEKLLSPSMEFEKRMTALIDSANKHELELRKIEAAEASKKQDIARELASFKAHVVNENFRIATEYRAALEKEITSVYTGLLLVETPANSISPAIDKLKTVISEMKPSAPVKFNRVLLSEAELFEAYNSIPNRIYAYANDQKIALQRIDELFANYENDLANADQAAKAIEEESSAKQAEQNQQLAAEQATNVLIAQAEAVTVDGPTVKREMKIVLVETEAYAMTIVANFLKHFQFVSKYIRVKSWSKLTIAQMADALSKHTTETGEQYNGLQIEEVCK